MKYQCTHKATGLVLIITNEGSLTELSGEEVLIKACQDYLDSFNNSYQIRSEIVQMRSHYEPELQIQNGSLWSVDTNNPLFISKYLIPELQGMGYDCIEV